MVPTLSYMNVSISIVLVLVHKYIVYQQIVETCCEVLTFYCCNKYSLSISELQEHASSHCTLLWYTKRIVYQQNYYKIGAESLNSTCLQSFVHVYIQIIELQELACRIVMYGPKLFFVVFQKRRCLHKVHYAYFLCVTKLYHLTKFQMLVYSG